MLDRMKPPSHVGRGSRKADGSAGDADYASIGAAYTNDRIARCPPVSVLADGLGGVTTVPRVPIPLDCTDGFNDAYYGRPEILLDPAARLACSAWSFVEPAAVARFRAHLARDLADGTWDARHGHLRRQECLEGSLVLVVSTPGI